MATVKTVLMLLIETVTKIVKYSFMSFQLEVILPSGKTFVVLSFSPFNVRGSSQGLMHGSKVSLGHSHGRMEMVFIAVLSVNGELLAAFPHRC